MTPKKKIACAGRRTEELTRAVALLQEEVQVSRQSHAAIAITMDSQKFAGSILVTRRIPLTGAVAPLQEQVQVQRPEQR